MFDRVSSSSVIPSVIRDYLMMFSLPLPFPNVQQGAVVVTYRAPTSTYSLQHDPSVLGYSSDKIPPVSEVVDLNISCRCPISSSKKKKKKKTAYMRVFGPVYLHDC